MALKALPSNCFVKNILLLNHDLSCYSAVTGYEAEFDHKKNHVPRNKCQPKYL